MNNTANFIAKVYDTLAEIFNFSSAPQDLFFQMAWPGISLTPEDFKDSTGNYNANVAEEVFSDIANITPLFNKSKFEDSAMNLDNLYEIIIASARPSGVQTSEMENNPMFKLFANANYEFIRNEKGSAKEPNRFYKPSKATPSNWYDATAAQFWPKVEIKSVDSTPPNNTNSIFMKNGGMQHLEKGVWKLKPTASLDNKITKILESKATQDTQKIDAKMQKFIVQKTATTISPSAIKLTGASNFLKTNSKIGTPISMMVANTGFKMMPKTFAKEDMQGDAFKASLFKSMAEEPIKCATPVSSYQKQLDVLKKIKPDTILKPQAIDKTLSVKNRILLENLVISNLPTAPASDTTNGFSISFNYCRVNIDRPWMNLALLKMPNWYIFGSNSNLFSNGSPVDNPGNLPLISTSFIVIKNLKITANWSAEDKNNLNNSLSLGPFDIRNGSFNQNALEIPGMQIIAFTSKVTPPLAPINSI